MNYSIKNISSSYYASSSGNNVNESIGPMGPTGPAGSGNTETLNNVLFESPISKKSKTIKFLKNTKLSSNKIKSSLGSNTPSYQKITYGKNSEHSKIFVAVGDGDYTSSYSYDGIKWNKGADIFPGNKGNSVIWSGDKFVAVGEGSNQIAYSYDGINWDFGTNIFTDGTIQGIISNGKIFVAVGTDSAVDEDGENQPYGKSVAYSNDGIHWEYSTDVFVDAPLNIGFCLAWNGNMFLTGGVGGSTIGYSYDGKTWVINPAVKNPFINILDPIYNPSVVFGLSWNGKLFVAVGRDKFAYPPVDNPTQSIAYSYDGINWTNANHIFTSTGPPNDGAGQAVTWNGQMFVAVGSGDNTAAYSYNGTEWTASTNNPFEDGQGKSVTWDGEKFVAIGRRGIVSVGNTGSTAYSYNGKDWIVNNNNVFLNCNEGGKGITWSNILPNSITYPSNLIVSVGKGDDNTTAFSYDEKNAEPGNNIFLGGEGRCVTWNGKLFVSVGCSSDRQVTTAYSYDGVKWDSGTNIFEGPVGTSIGGCGVVWNNQLFVAVGSNLNNNSSIVSTAYSYNGKDWIASPNNVFFGGQSVTWNGKIFVAVGYGNNTVGWSQDGITWNSGTNNPFKTSVSTDNYGLGVTSIGKIFVAVGYNNDKTVSTATSNDGKTWVTGNTNPFEGGVGRGITNGKNLFVAVGHNEDYSVNTAYSTDGINWNTGSVFGGGGEVYGITWNGKMFIAVGSNYNATKTTSYSYDGKTWIETEDNVFGNGVLGNHGSSVVGTGFLYNIDMNTPIVAVGLGLNTIAYSLDGNKWNGLGNSIFEEGYGVVWNGNVFVAVGYGTNSIAYSEDNGINWIGLGKSIFTGEGGYGQSVIWNGEMFLAVGYSSNTIQSTGYSYDGKTWFKSNNKILPICKGVTYNGDLFVAVGNNSNNQLTTATSTDGITWIRGVNNPFGNNGVGNAVTWNRKVFVAVGYNSNNTVTTATSIDGKTWIAGVNNPFIGGVGYAVASNDSIIVAVGYNDDRKVNTAYSTDNGQNWTTGTVFPTSGEVYGITWNGKMFIAVGSNYDETKTIAYSYDGITWYVSNNTTDIFQIGYGVGGDIKSGIINTNSILSFEAGDTLTFNVDNFSNNVQDVSVSFTTE
jgi:hypothetical protein